MKANNKVTQAEVNAAIQRFVKQGGLIRKLPEQRSQSRQVGQKYEVYETLSNLPFSQ